MLLSYCMLAISVSIDSLGIGITYGLRNTKIITSAKVILFLLSFFITTFSILLGNMLLQVLPEDITTLIGASILCMMGIWVIYQAFHKREESISPEDCATPKKEKTHSKKVYRFFIRSLGITINIIRDPITSDLDSSHIIDTKEALYLGLAMSIDSICVGIGGSIIGLRSLLFPIMVATFQLLFLSIGRWLGIKIANSSNIKPYIWNILSGLLLIGIGISRLFL